MNIFQKAYCIVQLLGKQYIFQPNFWYDIPYINKNKIGDFIFLNKILLLNVNNIIQLGFPFLNNNYIIAKIVQKKIKSKKLIILKTKPKKHYTRIKGYRSIYTRIKIDFLNNL